LPRSGIYTSVQRTCSALIAGLLWLSGLGAHAAHTRATLLLSASVAKPGDSILAGVRLQMDKGWHTYWKNSGDSGQATIIQWHLPAGVAAGEIQWPLPEKFSAEGLTTYVYHDEAVLLVPLRLATDLKPGPLELKAKVKWLECETLCVPGSAEIGVRLDIGEATKPSADASLIEAWRAKLPRAADGLNARASWDGPAHGNVRPLLLQWDAPAPVKDADFFPYPGDQYEVQAAVENLTASPGKIRLRKPVRKLEGDWPASISGVLVQTTGNERQGFAVDLAVGPGGAGAGGAATPPAAAVVGAVTGSLGQMLFYAFIGGLILNVMPCVFPVIALKILGFVQQSRDEPRRVFTLGLVYALGVLVSFLIMAAIVVAIQQAGGTAGWGMQFKSPQLSVGLIALVVLIALNLFGVFEVNLGGRTLAAAGQLAGRTGAAGAFFHGVLATVLATPCTAPVLASALGFAFTQPPAVIVLFFLTIGLGLASPYLLLSWKPGWLKFLPRPGRWMERFKVAMGFPMLATAVWIFWFTAPRFGENGVIWVGFFLVGLACAAWIWGEFVQRAGRRRGVGMVVAAAVLLASYGYALEGKLRWRAPASPAAGGHVQNEPDGVQWIPWSAETLARARREGRPVLVDFTAKWCVTCMTVVKAAVDNREVRRKLDEINGVALLADNTDYPADVTAELYKFRSDGAVPLVLVYPRDASRPPEVLPTLPSRKEVLDALDRAARQD
jgi:thiol:disulfide interchange protein/DsbC/DsbD-like thiol-disulfide interchange protein